MLSIVKRCILHGGTPRAFTGAGRKVVGQRSRSGAADLAMLHGLGLQVCAEGVSTAEDIPALWACGVDAVTGTAVAAR